MSQLQKCVVTLITVWWRGGCPEVLNHWVGIQQCFMVLWTQSTLDLQAWLKIFFQMFLFLYKNNISHRLLHLVYDVRLKLCSMAVFCFSCNHELCDNDWENTHVKPWTFWWWVTPHTSGSLAAGGSQWGVGRRAVMVLSIQLFGHSTYENQMANTY